MRFSRIRKFIKDFVFKLSVNRELPVCDTLEDVVVQKTEQNINQVILTLYKRRLFFFVLRLLGKEKSINHLCNALGHPVHCYQKSCEGSTHY